METIKTSFTNLQTWITANHRNTIISAVSGGVLALCLICSCISLATNGNKPASGTNTTASHPSATQTPTAHASATPKPATATPQSDSGTLATGGSEKLGGTIDAFTADLGVPDTSTQLIYRYNRTCGDGGNDYCLAATVFPGKNNLFYVFYLDITYPTSGWDIGQAEGDCAKYLPSDAQFKQEVTVIQGGQILGIDRVYMSQSLAQRFTADQFQDAKQNQVTPGLFDVFYLEGGTSGTQVSDCTFALGTSQESA